MVTSSVLLGRCVPSKVTPIYPPKFGCARHDAGTTFQRFAAANTSMVLAIAPVAQGLPRRAYRVQVASRLNPPRMGRLTLNMLLHSPIRLRDRGRAHSRQDCRVEGQGHVVGRQCAARLRRQGTEAGRQRGRGVDCPNNLQALRRAKCRWRPLLLHMLESCQGRRAPRAM
jgi:hypothetical protein